MATTGLQGTLYTVPNNTFYQQVTGENIISIVDNTGNISSLQTNINQARLANPSKFLSIQLGYKQTYIVATNSLTLSSNMALQGYNAILIADSNTTSNSLVNIVDGSNNVSINNLTLLGNNKSIYGIYASNVNRINIDKVTISNTNNSGIFLKGIDSSTYNNEMSITRCNVQSVSGARGIDLQNATQAICMDNTFTNCSSAIFLGNSAYSTIVNNSLSANITTGIVLSTCAQISVTNNYILSGNTGITNISNTNNSFNNIACNDIQNTTTGIVLGGSSNYLYGNSFTNNLTTLIVAAGAGTNNRIITTSIPLTATTQRYFYPPTLTNFHNNNIIINNTNRTDIVTSTTSLSDIQTAYNAAVAANPTNTFVIRPTAPIINGDTTFIVQANTCVVLSGTILLNTTSTAFSSNGASYLSFSGGTIDGQNTSGRYGLSFLNCSQILVENMTLQNFGTSSINVANSDVILFSGCLPNCIVDNVTINNTSSRGIWIKGSSQNSTSGFTITNNIISNTNQFGIDLDVTTSNSLVKFNQSQNNGQSGIFVEESANNNQIIANTCILNPIGINIYSNINGPCNYNTFVANRCISNTRGIRVGSAAGNLASYNFMFNNTLVKNTSGIDSQIRGSDNYFFQQYFNNNTINVASTNSAVFFNIRFTPTIATRLLSNGVYFTSNYFDETTYNTNKTSLDTIYSGEFDEVTIQGSSVAKRETNDGRILVSGYFDEVTGIV